MHNLNRYAKHRTCSRANQTEIYDLKNRFVELLYTRGCCTACWIHVLVLPAKRCNACYGSGDDGECDRCGGSGIYLSEKRLRFYVFKIQVGGQRLYCWHQPDHLVKFPVTTTREPAEWSGVERDKPLGMPRSKLAAAKALIGWVLEKSKEPETQIVFCETIKPIRETVQAELFA